MQNAIRLCTCNALVLAVLVLMPGVAFAELDKDRLYVSVSGVHMQPFVSEGPYSETETGNGAGLLVAVGSDAGEGFRAELEAGYRRVGLERFAGSSLSADGTASPVDIPIGGDLDTMSLMFNGYYVFDAGRFQPYLGVGIGAARHDSTVEKNVLSDRLSDRDTVFAYQVMAGVALTLQNGMELRFGYRYVAADFEFMGYDRTYGTHGVEAGVLFRF